MRFREAAAWRAAAQADWTGRASCGPSNVECANDQEREPDRALTRSVKRDTRREAVLRFRAPLDTAFPIAETASRKEVLASSNFFSARAYWTFLTTVFTAFIVARFRSCRRSAWRARRIVDL